MKIYICFNAFLNSTATSKVKVPKIQSPSQALLEFPISGKVLFGLMVHFSSCSSQAHINSFGTSSFFLHFTVHYVWRT